MTSGCRPCAARAARRLYTAVDRLTGECLVYDEEAGLCRRYSSAVEARSAAEANGHRDPGVRRVQS
jgi:hypothetical protein